MNYYQFHIADWALHTAHLTLEEEGVYRRLLDHYYDTELPIPVETQPVIRRLRLRGYEETVALILEEFFTLEADGWHNRRADKEIDAYHEAKKSHWGSQLTKAQRCAIQAARNAAKVNATPGWLSVEQKELSASIYADSAMKTAITGVPHEVDHIIPLRGKTVCGLHVPWNLRVIPAYENRIKSNREVMA